MTDAYQTPVPYSQDAEEAVIGSLLINPDAAPELLAILKPEAFFILRHQYIWEAIARLHHTSQAIDLLTVREELRTQSRLNDIGGVGYLTQLTLNVPTSVNAEVYARLVERAAVRRSLLTAADKIRGLAMDETLSLDRVRTDALTEVDNAVTLHEENLPGDMMELMGEGIDRLDELAALGEGVSGLSTGFSDYDEVLDGIQETSFNLVGARPGAGKSSWLLCLALNAAHQGKAVYFWTGEMSRRELRDRLISIETGIPGYKLRRGPRANGMTPADTSLFVRASAQLAKMRILIDDRSSITPLELESRVKRAGRKWGGVDLLIIDYVGLMEAGIKTQNREQEMSKISRKLKQIAQDYCPVYAAAQLNRGLENRADKHPILADLRDSGSLEQDADTVTFVYRDVMYNEETEHPDIAEMIVAKNRHGSIGTIKLHFDKASTRFSDAKTQTIDLSGL